MSEKEIIICRCEEVTYSELQETIAQHNCSARELKLRTRAGMGYCGGRTCRTLIDSIAHSTNKRNIAQIALKYQPPIRPVRFGQVEEAVE